MENNKYEVKKVRNIHSNFLFCFIIVFTSCQINNSDIQLNGRTMGTTYSIKVIDFDRHIISSNQLQLKIDSVLLSINEQMSTYISDSEISIFNRPSTKSIVPSKEFLSVLQFSEALANSTSGLFDITVGPLIQLWGFSNYNDEWLPPSEVEISQLLDHIGINTWGLVEGELQKNNPHIQIDVNAIAKGLGVDAVSSLITSFGFSNFMVEIGGEVYCSGKNDKSIFWQIGIELPEFESRSLSKIANISDRAMATSGDYRNYFSYNGKTYSHIMNPKSGRPIEHSLASATVISSTCMKADGIATALLVMGTNDALSFIESNSGVECLLIERVENGNFKTFMSSGFGEFLLE